jgi:hypothetical protein
MNWIFRRPFDFGARARRWRTATLPIVLEFVASGGMVFGGSADVAFTTAPVASGGMVFGGAAGIAITRVYVASGGMIFGGSAAVSFTVAPPVGGDIVFGGAADVAFTKAIVGSGGIVFGGRAYIGDVIGSKFWLNGPGFELGDLLRAQQVDFDKDHNPIGVYSIDAEVVEIRSGQKMVLEVKAGKEYLTSALKGQIEFVRLGNRLDSARQGSVMVTSQPACVAVIDGVDDFSKWGVLSTYKGVFGKLSWINDPDFGQLSGWGAFIPNLYAKGNVILGPYSSIQWANVAGTGKPADNATVGATWGSDLTGIPIRFADAPSGAGLYICSSYMGYYTGSAWTTYMDSSGNFYLGGTSGALQWNGVSLTLSTVGNLSGAQGKAVLMGGEILFYGSKNGGANYMQTGYMAGEYSASSTKYLNIVYENYLRVSQNDLSYWQLVLIENEIMELRGYYTKFLNRSTGAVTILIDHSSGFASGLDADMLDSLHLSSVANAGGSSAATNPTLKRTVTLGGVTFDVACFN